MLYVCVLPKLHLQNRDDPATALLTPLVSCLLFGEFSDSVTHANNRSGLQPLPSATWLNLVSLIFNTSPSCGCCL